MTKRTKRHTTIRIDVETHAWLERMRKTIGRKLDARVDYARVLRDIRAIVEREAKA